MDQETRSTTIEKHGNSVIIEPLIRTAPLDAALVACAIFGPKLPPYQGD